ncbi:PREDICTED: inositol polyphosphate 1-phosphatase-like [Priapulus caudatus]|uniref:inositol-1,4-bisphosphate 1-phosphatase n=1 Tax=Priapulus caudatus TaxID=37621 RepID=A0ABM1DQG3_PRICU|nr:PREDICTED: inositol polyphosphate 1-phosphatase-like [Priapulus caudatus]
MREFLEALINVSEKAANIARQCRQERALFELLVQEKTGNQKNKRFLQDFKTLGDVLIQETVKHDIGRKFPDIAERIFGEESNKFTNTKGETIRVDVKNTEEETCELLAKVLDGNMEAACLLAVAVHKEVRMKVDLNNVTIQLPLKDLGVWIDPIDSTAEYISGDCGVKAVNGIHPVGLQCVTVLIGVFDWATGVPVLGVINQPFHKLSAEDDSIQNFVESFYAEPQKMEPCERPRRHME